MGFTFLHTADWQIGKPFRMFPAKVAGRLEEARLTAIDRLASCAREAGASHVFVAGDVYDASRLPKKTRQQPIERMKRHGDLVWVLLPGNHDPVRAGGIWSGVLDGGAEDNITVLTEPKPFEVAPGVVVLPAPLTARALSTDPTAWMDGAPTPDSPIRIGLAHGSVRGFGSQDDASITIDAKRADLAGLSYLALGDWHGMMKINARTWYSGTPEPDGFRDNEPGYALVVRVTDAKREPEVTPVPVSHFRWAQIAETLHGVAQLAGIERQISKSSDDPAQLLLRLKLDGLVDGAQLLEIEKWCDAWDARVAHLDVDLSGLRSSVDPANVAVIGDSTELSEAARRLNAMVSGDDPQQAARASAALRHLLVFAHGAQSELEDNS